MEFFAIMFIGTLVAIWVVVATRPAQRFYHSVPPGNFPQADQGERNAEIWQWEPMDEFEYLEAVAKYERDPVHNPFPSPVPPKIEE